MSYKNFSVASKSSKSVLGPAFSSCMIYTPFLEIPRYLEIPLVDLCETSHKQKTRRQSIGSLKHSQIKCRWGQKFNLELRQLWWHCHVKFIPMAQKIIFKDGRCTYKLDAWSSHIFSSECDKILSCAIFRVKYIHNYAWIVIHLCHLLILLCQYLFSFFRCHVSCIDKSLFLSNAHFHVKLRAFLYIKKEQVRFWSLSRSREVWDYLRFHKWNGGEQPLFHQVFASFFSSVES